VFLVAVLPRAARVSICVWADPNFEPKAVNPGDGGSSLVVTEQVLYCLLMGGGSYVLDDFYPQHFVATFLKFIINFFYATFIAFRSQFLNNPC